MTTDEKYMQRCIELAKNGLGHVSPNPMVGSVIVHNDCIIGEGFHIAYGQAHAEPNAIHAVKDMSLLKQSTLYVNLEPCSHFGKTPPCASLIIEKQIPRVVIGNVDPYPKVSGRGIQMLREAGVEVVINVLEEECRALNKRFFTLYEKKRPYIFLKWAQSADGFMDALREGNDTPPVQFSNALTAALVHKQRAEEAGILIGTDTAVKDNPRLTNRLWAGKSPLRMAVDRQGRIPAHYHLFDGSVPTVIFTEQPKNNLPNVSFVRIDFSSDLLRQIIDEAVERKIDSIIVEGGQKLLSTFIAANLWDEAQIEVAPVYLKEGVSAPLDPFPPDGCATFNGNKVFTYKNHFVK